MGKSAAQREEQPARTESQAARMIFDRGSKGERCTASSDSAAPDLTTFGLPNDRADIDRPCIRVIGRMKRPNRGRLPAPRAQAEAIAIAVHFVEAGRARGDLHERLPVDVQENAFARDHDGGALVGPAGIAAGRPEWVRRKVRSSARWTMPSFANRDFLFRRELTGVPGTARGEERRIRTLIGDLGGQQAVSSIYFQFQRSGRASI